MFQLRHYDGLNHLHVLTSSTYGRARLFDAEHFKCRFVSTLGDLRRELNFRIIGYVLMAEHFHLLLWPSAQANPSQIMQKLEDRTALEDHAMKKTSIRFLLWAVAALAISTACSNLLHRSPENVVKAFFNAANDGKYSEAVGYLASSKKVIVAAQGGIKPLADRRTRDGNIESVDIIKVETRGEGPKSTTRFAIRTVKQWTMMQA